MTTIQQLAQKTQTILSFKVYAKLLAMLVQHWLLFVSCWCYPDRSLQKAARTVQRHGLHLASMFGGQKSLCEAIAITQRCLAAGCRINKPMGRVSLARPGRANPPLPPDPFFGTLARSRVLKMPSGVGAHRRRRPYQKQKPELN